MVGDASEMLIKIPCLDKNKYKTLPDNYRHFVDCLDFRVQIPEVLLFLLNLFPS